MQPKQCPRLGALMRWDCHGTAPWTGLNSKPPHRAGDRTKPPKNLQVSSACLTLTHARSARPPHSLNMICGVDRTALPKRESELQPSPGAAGRLRAPPARRGAEVARRHPALAALAPSRLRACKPGRPTAALHSFNKAAAATRWCTAVSAVYRAAGGAQARTRRSGAR